MREANFAPSPALLKLAEITDFNLYVSTTFDTLMEDALNVARFAGACHSFFAGRLVQATGAAAGSIAYSIGLKA